MKFQLVIEPDSQRLILLPENSGEQQILASLYGDPPLGSTPAPSERSRGATIEAEWSTDRAPYKKLLKLRIKFGHGEASDVE